MLLWLEATLGLTFVALCAVACWQEDELAVNDTLDHKQLHKKRQYRAYYEEHKDEIAAKKRAYREEHKDEIRTYQRTYQREYRKRKRQQENMIAAEIKTAAPDTAMSESGT